MTSLDRQSVTEKLAHEGIRPRNHGEGNQKLTCPKCSHTRRDKSDPCLSLTISHDGAVWKCHNCEWSGGVYDRDPHERWHAAPPARPPVRIDRRPESLPAHAIAFFADRGISEDALRFADVGWSTARSAVMFPYRKPGDTALCNAKFRKLPKDGFSQIKDGEKVYWLLDKLDVAVSAELIIVEGEMDALSLIEAGIPNVLSVPDGAPKTVGQGDQHAKKFSFIPTCDQWIEPFERIVVATDADGPGEALAEELARRYGKDRCWVVKWPAGIKDANEYLIQHGKVALGEWCRKSKPWPIEGLYDVSDYRDQVLSLFWQGRARGVSTGFPSLDPLYTVAPGQLTVVTGIPNNGKSEIIDQFMVNLAKREGWTFGICSFENEPPEHISKLVEKWIGMPFWDGPTARMTSFNLEAAIEKIEDHFRFIRNEGQDGPTIKWILDMARQLVKRYGILGLVIDPYNEIEHRRPGNMTETEYVSLMLAEVTRFAKLHGVHVWFIAHPAKMKPDDRGKVSPPSLYDISGSANFVNKTDNGLTIHRGERDGTTDVFVRKVRAKWVGQRGRATLGYDRVTGRYSDLGETSLEGGASGNGR
ncbi:toprim domain-containing protein [Sphingomonas nostoxanthinifaciens]|uniref:toprim domain-containing protein n=1 Tax=Sphingomonas nostoxanthinifaciens TaxID=2872652 RepID=UPI001CC1FECC|nr:toprim domain-containing protein [Sphingomonas nostoxanthinifaciens]UAK25850.1 toprim domain-containing protein [Sphingomonas nostoxanthinifaciens]